MNTPQVLKAVEIVRIIQKSQEKLYVYITYPALTESGPCNTCLENETQDAYTTEEIQSQFEYAEQISPAEWIPHVHINCVCRMFLYEEQDIEEDQTVTLTEDGLPTMPKHLSDEQFDDWLTGLLSAGYITATIYDAVVARRKKKKTEQKKGE